MIKDNKRGQFLPKPTPTSKIDLRSGLFCLINLIKNGIDSEELEGISGL